MDDSPTTPAQRYLGFKQMYERYGFGRKPAAFRVWLWRLVRAGKWPAPTRFTAGTIAWNEAEVEAHVASLPRQRTEQETEEIDAQQ